MCDLKIEVKLDALILSPTISSRSIKDSKRVLSPSNNHLNIIEDIYNLKSPSRSPKLLPKSPNALNKVPNIFSFPVNNINSPLFSPKSNNKNYSFTTIPNENISQSPTNINLRNVYNNINLNEHLSPIQLDLELIKHSRERSRTSSPTLPFRSPPIQTTKVNEVGFKNRRKSLEIGQFYFPLGYAPNAPNTFDPKYDLINDFFRNSPNGIPSSDLHSFIKLILGLPSYLSGSMYLQLKRFNEPDVLIDNNLNILSFISKDLFIKYYSTELQNLDAATQVFTILKSPGLNYLRRENFLPLVQEVVDGHPGLEFLEQTPEFQQRYIQTVIARIFYNINRNANEKLTLGELKKSNLLNIFHMLDQEDDINKIHDYFSYEHFYVLYVKFWELDQDHDFFLSRVDLGRYGDECLTPRVYDRIMSQIPRRFLTTSISLPQPVPGRMSFEDFIVFMISEEDKTTDMAKEYWFKVLDYDGDGYLSRYDLMYFFEEQRLKMEFYTKESIAFANIYCQVIDMLEPNDLTMITLAEIKASKLAPFVFNIFTNLNKFVRNEQRDVLAVERERAFADLSEWDRFAIGAYFLLSGEEEQQQQRVYEVMDEGLHEYYEGGYEDDLIQ